MPRLFDGSALILVFVGGGTGAVARYLAGAAGPRAFGVARPYLSTLGINVLGGLLMGMLAGTLALRGGASAERWRLLVGVGMLGGFTTFSSFSLEAMRLIERRNYGEAVLYALASTGLAIGAVAVGLWICRRGLA